MELRVSISKTQDLRDLKIDHPVIAVPNLFSKFAVSKKLQASSTLSPGTSRTALTAHDDLSYSGCFKMSL